MSGSYFETRRKKEPTSGFSVPQMAFWCVFLVWCTCIYFDSDSLTVCRLQTSIYHDYVCTSLPTLSSGCLFSLSFRGITRTALSVRKDMMRVAQEKSHTKLLFCSYETRKNTTRFTLWSNNKWAKRKTVVRHNSRQRILAGRECGTKQQQNASTCDTTRWE